MGNCESNCNISHLWLLKTKDENTQQIHRIQHRVLLLLRCTLQCRTKYKYVLYNHAAVYFWCRCNPVAVVPPTCDTEKEKEYEEVCKIILENSGPFAVCHWYIPPQLYFESCVYDLCATEGNSEQFCKILEAYAAACELGGVNLEEWREGTICGKSQGHLANSNAIQSSCYKYKCK